MKLGGIATVQNAHGSRVLDASSFFVMLSAAKHLSAHRDRSFPFASSGLRLTARRRDN